MLSYLIQLKRIVCITQYFPAIIFIHELKRHFRSKYGRQPVCDARWQRNFCNISQLLLSAEFIKRSE